MATLPGSHQRCARLFLAVVIDLLSRSVVGWSTADHMHTANGLVSPDEFEQRYHHEQQMAA